ncbi:MAG: tetratricopeptide repeat protein, partial [Planctomycetes bacterium]|nr:tetratricopeptide repeat protein [Planctomycetota bacterium]
MKKTIYCVIMLSLLAPAASAAQLSNSRKLGQNIYSIDRILRLDDADIDICTAALVISRNWGTPKNLHRYRMKVDDMAEELIYRARRQGLRRDHTMIGLINEYLFEELGYEPVKDADNPEDLFLHTVLDKKRGYCLSLSVLYLSIGERLGLPLYGVVVPGHFFVRYDDGRKTYNIETTSKGAIAPDKHYIEKFNPPTDPDSVYMKNLTTLETLGCFFNNLGNSYSEVGDIETALIRLKIATEINPSLAEAHTNLGNAYLQKGMIEKALDEYLAALAILPDEHKTRNNLANVYVRLGLFNQAVAEYQEAIELAPDFAQAHKNLGQTYRRQGKMTTAARTLKKAISIDHNDAEAYSILGDIYRESDKPDSAIFHYKKALKIDPQFVHASSGLAHAYMESGKLKDAVRQFIATTEIDPANTNAYFGLAVACNKLGWGEDEIQAYQQLLAIDPYMVPALQNLGNIYLSEKMYEDAI